MQRTSTSRPSSPQKTPPTSKSASSENLVIPEAPKENALIRLLVTPITFISFLLSLFLIDAHNHSLRQHSHSSLQASQPPTTIFGKGKAFCHNLIFKSTSNSSSPYVYIHESSKEKVGVAGESDFSVKKVGDEQEQWYWRTKQKKMMRAEVADAFKIRKWVVGFLMIAIVAGLVLGVSVVVWWYHVVNLWLVEGGSSQNGLTRDW